MDVTTTGSFEDEAREEIHDKTYGEGEASSMDLGLPDHVATARSPGEEPAEETDQELSDEDHGDGGSSRAKPPNKDDVAREVALEVGFAWFASVTSFSKIYKIYIYAIWIAMIPSPPKSGDILNGKLSMLSEDIWVKPSKHVIFWEAVDNVGPVMANLLRVQSKMEIAGEKLKQLEQRDEVKKKLSLL